MKNIYAKEMKELFLITCFVASIFFTDAVAQKRFIQIENSSLKIPEKYTIGTCSFKIKNMFGGYLSTYSDGTPPVGIYNLPATGPNAPHVLQSFGIYCQSGSDNEVDFELGAKQVNGQWFRYDPMPDRPDLMLFEKSAHPQNVTLKGKNWTGVALTIDDTTGDEEKRDRMFHFCLIHKEQALCGSTPVVWLAHPKRNELWMMKAILQSVVFSDPPAPLSTSASSAAK